MKRPPQHHIVRLLVIPRGQLLALRFALRLFPVLSQSHGAAEWRVPSQHAVPKLPFTHPTAATANVIPRSRPFSNAARCPRLRFSCFMNAPFFSAVSTSSTHAPAATLPQFYFSHASPPLPSPDCPPPPRRSRWRCPRPASRPCPSRPDPRRSPRLPGTRTGTATPRHHLSLLRRPRRPRRWFARRTRDARRAAGAKR